VFKHNDAKALEVVLRASIAEGQPRTHRPWRKIMVIVEGIYSMEGELGELASVVAVCKKYKVKPFLFAFLSATTHELVSHEM
jgi:serine palmitoyltransferase